jgi:Flp pilus assembly protein TadG
MKVRVRRAIVTFWNDRAGGPLAELAMVVPLLLLLVFGTIEFASLLYQQHTITKGVQEAARFAARSPAVRSGGTCPPASAAWTGVSSTAATIATHDGMSGPLLLPNFTNATITITVSCGDATGLITSNLPAGTIPVVSVAAAVPARSLGFFDLLNIDPFILRATHEEMGIGL